MQTLKRGSKGEEVKFLQQALLSGGWFGTSSDFDKTEVYVDGDFGPKTEAAVRRFQAANNLVADGVVGPKTWAAMAIQHVDQTWTPDGWYRDAIRKPIHAGRIGGTITPYTTVVHTTDMLPGTMPALLKKWTSEKGAGNAAHFLIGRKPNESTTEWPDGGVVQMVPVFRNGNHAGGGGSFIVNGKLVHPNTISVGIELDCAGRLGRRASDGKFYYKNGSKLVEIPERDVIVDSRGIGWHRVTDYQFQVLDTLLRDLDGMYTPALTYGVSVTPKGTYKDNVVTWGAISGHIVGHVTLNPTDKTDPGPQVMDWLRHRAP